MTRIVSVLLRIAALPAIGYPLLLCWHRGWLPGPQGQFTVRLRDGRKLKCRLSDRTQRTMSLGLFEPAETRVVAELLDSGDTFIDIGAHIGWFTTLAAKRVSPDGLVIACEPYPANAGVLNDNLELNGIHNVIFVKAAVGSQPESLRLSGSESGAVTALNTAHGYSPQGVGVDVEVKTLDEVAATAGVVKLLKIDVEGWESQVLRGAPSTLARTMNVLIEINYPLLPFAGSSEHEIMEILRGAGFTCFKPIAQRGLRRLWRNSELINLLATRLSSDLA
jgi:FkbM family methyltransferase